MVNPIGVGVLENFALNPFMNNICKYFFNEELLIPQIATWWCGQENEREFVIENFDNLIIKSINKRVQKHTFIISELDQEEKESVWNSVILNQGSVQHLDFLSDWEKDVFKTAFELDQRWVVEHAGNRQEFVCQGQSDNLFFPAGSNKNHVLMTHIKAWKVGLKALYYLRTNAGVDPEKVSAKVERVALADYAEEDGECLSCQG